MKELSGVQSRLKLHTNIKTQLDDAQILYEMAVEENDPGTLKECGSEVKTIEEALDLAMIEASFTGKHDASNAIVAIHPGAGGTESCDWANMLYRMYSRWAEQSEFGIQELDRLPGDEAGIKSVTFMVNGVYAYGKLCSERGVHRLVRISPFDSAARRHTSFASVEVMPEIADDIEVEINEDDLRVDTFRSTGAGGQHVNTTDSAVRITHMPTKIVVSCQNERSQIKNRATAMKILRARLYDYQEAKRQEEINKLRGEKKEIGWGSQIRSYVLQPYTMCKDVRTGHEVGNAQGVLDGNLNGLMNSWIKWRARS